MLLIKKGKVTLRRGAKASFLFENAKQARAVSIYSTRAGLHPLAWCQLYLPSRLLSSATLIKPCD